ncbi:MAG: hypothetical protein NTV34_12990 [Proteobacteria bacterium]|nr:hypothetical protein [Pseudomonadota bacterium]
MKMVDCWQSKILAACAFVSTIASGANLIQCNQTGVDTNARNWRVNWTLSHEQNDQKLRLTILDTRASSALKDSAKSFGLVNPERFDSLEIILPAESCSQLLKPSFPTATMGSILNCLPAADSDLRVRFFAASGTAEDYVKVIDAFMPVIGIGSSDDDGSLDVPSGPSRYSLGKFYFFFVHVAGMVGNRQGMVDLMTIIKGENSCQI